MNNATHVRGSAIWIRFPRVVCGRWVHHETIEGKCVPIVLTGDAAHTAHFSIGSGTKLALEDAIELARCFATNPEADAALQAYEAVRFVEALKIQNAARNSTEWFENVNRCSAMEVEQFFHSMTRSQRISHENLRVRDTQWLQGYEQWLAKSTGKAPPPPMLLPLKVRGLTLKNRIVVSPMAMYSAVDGVSSGQTTRDAQPVYCRLYQTPFADRIRNEVGIQTMAVGAISEADHVNSIIAAGHADLCALASAHLADPAWTLHEAAKLQSRQVSWPQPYRSGRDQLYREIFKQKELLAQAQRALPAIK